MKEEKAEREYHKREDRRKPHAALLFFLFLKSAPAAVRGWDLLDAQSAADSCRGSGVGKEKKNPKKNVALQSLYEGGETEGRVRLLPVTQQEAGGAQQAATGLGGAVQIRDPRS